MESCFERDRGRAKAIRLSSASSNYKLLNYIAKFEFFFNVLILILFNTFKQYNY